MAQVIYFLLLNKKPKKNLDTTLQTEKQLIQGCLKGRESSQYELVKRYSGTLLTICRRYATDEPTAKDMLQEALIRIFTYLPQYKMTGSFEGWLKRITVNCALTWLKRKNLKYESSTDEFSYQETIEPKVMEQYNVEEIIGYIQELPIGFRTVFNLNIMEGYNHKEIAKMLSITESTSRSQLARARKMLQAKINDSALQNYKSA